MPTKRMWEADPDGQGHLARCDFRRTGRRQATILFNPGSVISGARILRRFLYHFLFRGVGHEVRILVLTPSPSISSFWIQTSIGVWPSSKSVAWSGLGF